MNSFKIFNQRLIYLLAFIICFQGFFSVHANDPRTYQKIEDVELEKKVDQLLLLVQKRLAIMHEVARTKWNQNLPIEDKIREQQILVELAEKASQYHLEPRWITNFFQAQIEASKEIQKMDFAAWEKENRLKFVEVFSLKDELRIYIDEINHEMILLLNKILNRDFDANRQLILSQPISSRKTDHINHEVWQLAISPLKEQF